MKKLIIFMALITAMFCFASCGSTEKAEPTASSSNVVTEEQPIETAEEEPAVENALTTFDEVEAALGLSNGEVQYYEMIDADYGKGYETPSVELYEFDSADNEGMANFIETYEGVDYAQNGRFLLCSYEEGNEELLETLKS